MVLEIALGVVAYLIVGIAVVKTLFYYDGVSAVKNEDLDRLGAVVIMWPFPVFMMGMWWFSWCLGWLVGGRK